MIDWERRSFDGISGTIIDLDIAEHVFQVHGTDSSGRVRLKKRFRCEQFDRFLWKRCSLYTGDGADNRCSLLGQVIRMFGYEIRLMRRSS